MAARTPDARLHAQVAANTRWAKCDNRTAATAAAREGQLARFEAEVDPNGELNPTVRRERAVQLRRAHMQNLARASARKRRAAR